MAVPSDLAFRKRDPDRSEFTFPAEISSEAPKVERMATSSHFPFHAARPPRVFKHSSPSSVLLPLYRGSLRSGPSRIIGESTERLRWPTRSTIYRRIGWRSSTSRAESALCDGPVKNCEARACTTPWGYRFHEETRNRRHFASSIRPLLLLCPFQGKNDRFFLSAERSADSSKVRRIPWG